MSEPVADSLNVASEMFEDEAIGVDLRDGALLQLNQTGQKCIGQQPSGDELITQAIGTFCRNPRPRVSHL